MGEPMTLERALDVAAVPPKHSRDEVFEAITLLADAHVAEKARADKADGLRVTLLPEGRRPSEVRA